ncbi:unnamed protein product [Gadus morhua 'NCC']
MQTKLKTRNWNLGTCGNLLNRLDVDECPPPPCGLSARPLHVGGVPAPSMWTECPPPPCGLRLRAAVRAVVCCSDGSDFESDTVHQPTKRVAAQGSSVAPTAISSSKRSKQENVVWKLKLENAKEKIKSLENERDFLRNQLSEALALANKEDQETAAPSLHEKILTPEESIDRYSKPGSQGRFMIQGSVPALVGLKTFLNNPNPLPDP